MQIIAYYLIIQQIIAKTDRYLRLSSTRDVVGKQTNHLRSSAFICGLFPTNIKGVSVYYSQ